MDSSIFTSIKVDRIFEKVIKQIRQLIEDGVLKPGDKLPSERDLAETLGCSRASIREAYRVLELEGVLVTKHGEGRFVQQVDTSLVMEYRFNPLDLIEKSTIRYFLEARETLEPKIAALAAERAKQENFARMEKALIEQFRNPDEEVSKENSFILAMAEASQNFVFFSTVESYLNMMRKVQKKSQSSPNSKERLEASKQELKNVLEAIKNRDSERAAEAMLIHLHNIREHILKE